MTGFRDVHLEIHDESIFDREKSSKFEKLY